MMYRPWLIALLSIATVIPAMAQSFKVDDSGSQVLGGTLRLKPQTPVRRDNLSLVSGEAVVLARLNVAPWQGRQARIYMLLPPQPAGQIVASWSTQGRLMPGQLRSGERTLVYAGPIETGLIEDTLRLQVQADGSRLARDEQLAFSFEIDLETP